MVLSSKVMRGGIPWVCVAFVAVAVGCVRGDAGDGDGGEGVACVRGRSWWARARGACVPCSRCDAARRLAVLLPCEPHRDTVCHSLDEVRLWPDAPAAPADEQYYDYADYDSDTNTTAQEPAWDLQTPSLLIALSGCLVFFIVVLVLSLSHVKQWRILKQALKSDVQDLTAKLKLMETGEAPTETVVASDHHIYCNIHAGKETLLGPTSIAKGFGNVYTQEKHPS